MSEDVRCMFHSEWRCKHYKKEGNKYFVRLRTCDRCIMVKHIVEYQLLIRELKMLLDQFTWRIAEVEKLIKKLEKAQG